MRRVVLKWVWSKLPEPVQQALLWAWDNVRTPFRLDIIWRVVTKPNPPEWWWRNQSPIAKGAIRPSMRRISIEADFYRGFIVFEPAASV
jgi:hypothetical protein